MLPAIDIANLGIFRTKPIDDKSGMFVRPWNSFFQNLEVVRQNAPQYFFTTTHTQRLKLNAQNVGLGSLFLEKDRNLFYVSNGTSWQYFSGVFQTVHGLLPQDLTSTDTGVLVSVTDFNHMLMWDGNQFQWAAGDSGSGYTVPFVGTPPSLVGWHPADGSTNVKQMMHTGSFKIVTVPNTAGSYFRQ